MKCIRIGELAHTRQQEGGMEEINSSLEIGNIGSHENMKHTYCTYIGARIVCRQDTKKNKNIRTYIRLLY